ncbi:MAG: hypothetical protein L6V35_05735 [Alistipes putredinis]|nr:MAG: hypothetical protein L6V35_05735 [Alistipes putredinis]
MDKSRIGRDTHPDNREDMETLDFLTGKIDGATHCDQNADRRPQPATADKSGSTAQNTEPKKSAE